MKKILAITLLIIFSVGLWSIKLKAQWNLQNPYPTGNTIYSLAVLNDSSIFLGGDNGVFIKSTDGGKTWSSNKVTTYPILQIHFFDNNLGLMVSGEKLYKTENGGSTWEVISGNEYIDKFYFLTPNIGWASGYLHVLKTTDGGKSWKIIFSDTFLNYDISAIDFFNENVGWIAGSYGIPQKTTDGGKTWTFMSLNGNDDWNDLYFIDQNTGWAATGWPGMNGSICKTTDSGNNWTVKNVGNDILENIQAITKQIIYTSGGDGLFKSIDGGENWGKIYNQGIQDFHFRDKLNGWAVSSYKIIKTTDGGNNWNMISRQINSDNFKDVDFYNSTNGFIIGENGTVLKTTDKGLNWSVQNINIKNNLNAMELLVNKMGWIVGDSSLVLKTTNSGKSWEVQDIGSSNSNFNSISFYDDMNGVITSDSGQIFVTYDGGNNWEQIKTNFTDNINSVFYLNKNSIWTACRSGVAMEISNKEVIKRVKMLPAEYPNVRLYSIYFFNELEGLVAGGEYDNYNHCEGGLIYKTFDGGNTWVLKKVSRDFKNYFSSLFALDSVEVYAVTTAGFIFASTDKGESWGSQISPRNIQLNKVYFFDRTNGWIIGNDGTISYTDNGGGEIYDDTILLVHNNKIQTKSFLLSQNYPNPFNPTTTIKYSVPKESLVTIKVYDVLGKEIKTLVNEDKPAGSYEVEFNGSKYPSGIYFYRIRAGSYSTVKKMILVK